MPATKKRLFGLIGFPLGHSFSQQYFTAFFQREGLADVCSFENFAIESIDQLPGIITTHPTLEGLFVTIPHKQAVLPLLDQIDPAAAQIGAVNCIRIDRTHERPLLTGYNTDYYGFLASLSDLLRTPPTRAYVLGTGGASKAVCCALEHLKIPFVSVSRSGAAGTLRYEQLRDESLSEVLIVNATPVGTSPKSDCAPAIPYELLTSKSYLFDLVYNPAETLFLRNGRKQGAWIKNGLQMLQNQAQEGWRILNSTEPK